MDPDFWLQRWNENKIGFHQPDFNTHLTGYWQKLALQLNDHIFVPLCGKSSDLVWLHKQGHSVSGIEISNIAVEAFFEENKLPVETQQKGQFVQYDSGAIRILCGDFFNLACADLETERDVDYGAVRGVFDRAALIALPPLLRKRYVQHLLSLLNKQAKCLLVTLEYPQLEMAGPPYSVPESEVMNLYSGRFKVEILHESDILQLQENERFKSQGLSYLIEKVYLLKPH